MSEIKQMDDKAYFALDAIDQSALKRYMVSPLAYVDYLDHGLDVSDEALNFGTIAHSMVLGTDCQYAVKPNQRTQAGKYAAAELKKRGVVLSSAVDIEAAKAMAKVSAPYFQAMTGSPEVAVIAEAAESGLPIKGKFDWLPKTPDDDGVLRIRDYKTTRDDPTDFPRVAARLGYHIQAAFYMMLYRLTGFTGELGFEFVVQEKRRPYDYAIWRFVEGSEVMEIAMERIERALDEIAGFKRANPSGWRDEMRGYGLDKTPRDVEFTPWQMDKEAEEAGI